LWRRGGTGPLREVDRTGGKRKEGGKSGQEKRDLSEWTMSFFDALDQVKD
jgi:hypothetical protein